MVGMHGSNFFISDTDSDTWVDTRYRSDIPIKLGEGHPPQTLFPYSPNLSIPKQNTTNEHKHGQSLFRIELKNKHVCQCHWIVFDVCRSWSN